MDESLKETLKEWAKIQIEASKKRSAMLTIEIKALILLILLMVLAVILL